MPLAEDVSPRVARRVTSAGGVDARVAWSPSGDRLVFVRDDTSDTSIVALDLASGSEDVLVDTKALDLDPAFAPDGTLWYSSAEAGTIDLWRQRPGEEQLRITSDPGLELAPRPGPNGGVVYLAKTRGGIDELRARDAEGSETVLWSERIAAQTRPALSSGGLVALGHPGERGWELSLLDTNEPQTMIRLLPNAPGAAVGLPQTPTWSASGDAVLFVEPDAQQRFELKRIALKAVRPRRSRSTAGTGVCPPVAFVFAPGCGDSPDTARHACTSPTPRAIPWSPTARRSVSTGRTA